MATIMVLRPPHSRRIWWSSWPTGSLAGRRRAVSRGERVAPLLPPGAAAPPAGEPAPPPPPPAEPAGAEALGLLGLLQEEGRFVDFVTEDLARYPDEQIGAAVRGIHEGCRKVLDERVAFEPVLHAAEGETVTIEAGFDPAAIRLTGNVGGEPPFRRVP